MSRSLRSLFAGPARSGWVQLVRYAAVGGVAFAVDYGLLFVAAHRWSVHYLAAAALAFVAGLTVNYLLSIRWVFASVRSRDRRVEFLLFGLIGVAGLLWNEAVIWLASGCFAWPVMASKLLSTAVVFCWNFGARKYLLFQK